MLNARPSILLPALLTAVLGASCGGDPPPGPATDVTLRLGITDVDAAYAGKLIRAGLFAGTASCESNTGPGAYAGMAMVAAGACEIAIAAVTKGSYTACAFLDIDGDAQPSVGDLAGQLSLTLSEDKYQTWSVRDWITIVAGPPSTVPSNVGYQELTLTDSSRGRTLRTAFWYPTVDGAPDASGGPYPLILFSHGDHGSSTNGKGDFLKNAWASQGFVVAAPDHQKNTWYDADDSDANRAAIQFDRPLDIRFVTDQALLLNADRSSFLFGMIDPNAIGMSGHSFGGHTTLMVAGATPNLDHLADYCQVNPDNWDICPLQDRIQQLYPGQRIIDVSDPRMKAALSLAGDGYGWFREDGMAKIKMPIMFMTGKMDTICPLDTQAMPEYQASVSAKYLFMQDYADHMAFVNGCSQATASVCDRLHEQIESLSIAFWTLHLKMDTSSAEVLRTFSQPDATLLSEPAR